MTDAHNVIHAVGMKFDNKSLVMKLLSQVKANMNYQTLKASLSYFAWRWPVVRSRRAR